MKVLVKLGGTLLDDETKLGAMARQLSEANERHQLVLVHGGGKQVTRYLEERGVPSRFVGGLRVSDSVVIDAVTKVIAGTVNTHLVSALAAAGQQALGLSGVDGGLTRAEQLHPELQFVGRPIHSNGPLLQLLVDAGYLPVVACLAGDVQGRVFNVNADQMAVSCAVSWGAERLIFLTDVDGVTDAAGEVFRTMTPAGVAKLIGSGVAYGGMQAKLESATAALNAGLHVTIASGAEPSVAPAFARRSIGNGVVARMIATALNVRKAGMRDIPELLGLINSYATQGVMLPRTEFEMSENIRDFTVAYDGGLLAGCGALHFYTPTSAEVRSLAVLPERKQHGVGRAVVEALETEAKDNDLESIFAFTYVPGFFARLGFQEVERGELPLKAWKDCLRCPKFHNCDEIAVIKHLIEPSVSYHGYTTDLSNQLVQLPTPAKLTFR